MPHGQLGDLTLTSSTINLPEKETDLFLLFQYPLNLFQHEKNTLIIHSQKSAHHLSHEKQENGNRAFHNPGDLYPTFFGFKIKTDGDTALKGFRNVSV
ncbi:MAG: hypothetical protein CMI18_05895 [Opitutaceae bacterium]|nr:hypothetical protein [Opitutaceae bacterium]|tara:strand:- start:539 stop:832 length:294 start_codon:yes stop_codon:yes gene_type:complete